MGGSSDEFHTYDSREAMRVPEWEKAWDTVSLISLRTTHSFGLPFLLQDPGASDLGLPESCSAEDSHFFRPPVTSKKARNVEIR